MKRRFIPPREVFILGTLFGALLLVAVVAPGRVDQGQSDLPSLSTYSSRPEGGLLLYRWLGQLGYRVERLEHRSFQVGRSASALFILDPKFAFDSTQGDEVERFVRSGGTVFYVSAGEPSAVLPRGHDSRPLLPRFGLRLERHNTPIQSVVPGLPLFTSPTVVEAAAETRTVVTTARGTDAVPLLSTDGPTGPVVMSSLREGDGRLIVLSAPQMISNQGLPKADNWRVILNLLPEPGMGVLLFDEYHHGLVEDESLWSVIWRRPWGWSVIGTGILGLAFISLRGRRFGRAVAVAQSGRRAPAEYVYSMSMLLRRGRHQGWVREHYAARLRTAARQRLGVESDSLGSVGSSPNGNSDSRLIEELRSTLDGLESSQRISDSELVELVRSAEQTRNLLEHGERG